jgi:uncharacterized protein YegJ (DUF2314 family)
MYRKTFIPFLSLILLMLACSLFSRDEVTLVKSDDPEMNAAIQKARDTVNAFIKELESPKPNQTDFSVKMKVVDGENNEHMWLNSVYYDGQFIHGNIANDPVYVKNVKLGEAVKVLPEDISDWMYVVDGKLVGGYTIRVLRNRLSPEEQNQFDSESWFKIED